MFLWAPKTYKSAVFTVVKRLVCSVWHLCFCQLFLSRLIHSSGGTKFEISREHVDSDLHFALLRRGRARLFDYELCCFLSRKLNEELCQFINWRCIYCYCFFYILYRLLNKQLRQLLRKRSLSESKSYHISINKQRFYELNNCCLPSLCHFTRNKSYTVSL